MDFNQLSNWQFPTDDTIVTIEAHTAGEPLRVIVRGFPDLPGQTILQRRRACRQSYDDWRKALMWEPRGHADMYGCLVVPAEKPDSDFGVIFMHNEGYSTMCGHAIIALSKIAVESGLVAKTGPATELRIDTPAGTVTATYVIAGDGVDHTSFNNVPSFLVEQGALVEAGSLGLVRYDLAFGGAFYAYVSVDQVGLSCLPSDMTGLIDAARRIKAAINAVRHIQHPVEDELSFLYGVIFTGPPVDPANHSRNVCVFADGEVDRSPTGTGVSGRAAIEFAAGRIGEGQVMRIESIIGTTLDVQVVESTLLGAIEAVIPRVTGRACITGKSEFWLDPHDPLRHGFLLR